MQNTVSIINGLYIIYYIPYGYWIINLHKNQLTHYCAAIYNTINQNQSYYMKLMPKKKRIEFRKNT